MLLPAILSENQSDLSSLSLASEEPRTDSYSLKAEDHKRPTGGIMVKETCSEGNIGEYRCRGSSADPSQRVLPGKMGRDSHSKSTDSSAHSVCASIILKQLLFLNVSILYKARTHGTLLKISMLAQRDKDWDSGEKIIINNTSASNSFIP